MPRGRPEKLYYKDIIDQVKKLAAIDLNRGEIAHILGISPSTIYEYEKKHPELTEAYKQGKAETIKKLKAVAIKKAYEEADGAMIKYVLNNISDWKEKPLIDQSTNLTKNDLMIVSENPIEIIGKIKEMYGDKGKRLADDVAGLLGINVAKDTPGDNPESEPPKI